MKLNDAVFGLILFILGATILVVVQGFPKIPGQQVGPALFPGLIAAGLCIGGVALMVIGWRDRATVPWLAFEDWVRSPRHVLAFAVLVMAGMMVSAYAPNRFGKLLGAGLTFLIGMEALLNMGVTTALLPNKGLPLPFVSYGGSSLVAAMVAVGILIIEHDIETISNLCHRVAVLNFGELIANGTPDEVFRDPEVMKSYTGASHA